MRQLTLRDVLQQTTTPLAKPAAKPAAKPPAKLPATSGMVVVRPVESLLPEFVDLFSAPPAELHMLHSFAQQLAPVQASL